MCCAVLLISLFVGTPYSDDWKVPDAPNPTKILQSAQADTQSGDYETALAKFTWYHEHALEHDLAQYGVRLSFALGYWHELGKVYKPALKKLKAFRDEAGKQASEGKNAQKAFADFMAINRQLNEQKRTIDLFKKLDADNPKLAKSLATVAVDALIEAEEYKLIARHIDFKKEAKRAKEHYRQMKVAVPVERLEFLNEKMLGLLKVMIKTGKQDLAKEIGEEFKEISEDEKFHKKIDNLLGEEAAS